MSPWQLWQPRSSRSVWPQQQHGSPPHICSSQWPSLPMNVFSRSRLACGRCPPTCAFSFSKRDRKGNVSRWEGKWGGTGRSSGKGNHNQDMTKKIYFHYEEKNGTISQVKCIQTINIICASFSLDFLFTGLLLNLLLKGSSEPESRRLMWPIVSQSPHIGNNHLCKQHSWLRNDTPWN